MVPQEAPYPDVYTDTFIFFLRSLCKIIWMNVHYFPNASRNIQVKLHEFCLQICNCMVERPGCKLVWVYLHLVRLSYKLVGVYRQLYGCTIRLQVDMSFNICSCMVIRSRCELVWVYLQLYGRTIRLQVCLSLSATVWSYDQAASWY